MLEDSDIIATMKSKRISWAWHVMVRSRTDNRSGHLLEAEEQKTTWPSKTKMVRQGP